ncbi:Eco57I restriction-modification methylase domain-containing protein [Cellulomonas sp. PhB150]|uniref:Eco57I restriction-modification methylase domain-containing protein n=1 Tax=Cellulomonas sp. PhB150 TaxID=2485188 RepID=UPI000F476692|nr:Eco57I restriction-modification methylase domain-containing protein [Cellulomonas sp. PhB150]ROS27830.1 Eco57I restriction-modification methylase [Cellulomonas sp. PhB150]
MSKKFDVVIGNPPYQDDLIGDNEAKSPPIYHLFMDVAFAVAERAVLVTPARFLSNAGQTPKSWNEKTLSDEHLKVAIFEPSSSTIFPGTAIDGGIVVTYRDATRVLGPIGSHSHLSDTGKSLVDSVSAHSTESLASMITEHPCSWNEQVFVDHPELRERIPASSGLRMKTNTFERMGEVCLTSEPQDGHEYVRIMGLANRKRAVRWVRKDYVVAPEVVGSYKAIIAGADGAAVKSGRVVGMPTVVGPGTGFTQTFMSVGKFDSEAAAEACATYMRTKFARAMLGILKTTQHNSAIKWKHVPLQDFTAGSDIDWSVPIPQIDAQLYAKYELDSDEIAFIETRVKPME